MSFPKIVGIVNITSDSFSDGGEFLQSGDAILHAHELRAQGADIVEFGAASSNPNAGEVSAALEIERLTPVLGAMTGTRVSIDSTKPDVLRFALQCGVDFVNDIRGFPDESLYPQLASSNVKLIVMHAMTDAERADRAARSTDEVIKSITRFFETRIAHLEAAGISRDRIIIDPGMGYFLSSLPEPSFAVLAHLSELKRQFNLPTMVCVSRKSFLREGAPLGSSELRARTLAAELIAVENGADYIRTHESKQLREALRVHELTSEAGRDASLPK